MTRQAADDSGDEPRVGPRRRRPGRGRVTDVSAAARGLRVLTSDLRDLALDLQAGSYTRTTLAMFTHDLRRAVPSALGATIFFDLDTPTGVPKEIHLVERVLDPAEIASGLQIPLVLPQQSLHARVLFYASEPEAFDAVVTGLVALLDAQAGPVDASPTLPTSLVSPSVVAAQDFSLVNEALGVLISRGLTLTEARGDLQAEATRGRSDLPTAARRLLDGLPTRHGRRAGRLTRSPAPARVRQDQPTAGSATGASTAPREGARDAARGDGGRAVTGPAQSRSSALFLNQRVRNIISAARNGSTPRA